MGGSRVDSRLPQMAPPSTRTMPRTGSATGGPSRTMRTMTTSSGPGRRAGRRCGPCSGARRATRTRWRGAPRSETSAAVRRKRPRRRVAGRSRSSGRRGRRRTQGRREGGHGRRGSPRGRGRPGCSGCRLDGHGGDSPCRCFVGVRWDDGAARPQVLFEPTWNAFAPAQAPDSTLSPWGLGARPGRGRAGRVARGPRHAEAAGAGRRARALARLAGVGRRDRRPAVGEAAPPG